MKTTVTKTWPSVPFAHRAPNHDGHCRLIHGHNWTVSATFASGTRDANGFIVDFGKLKSCKAVLDEFDHALVLNSSDPCLPAIRDALAVMNQLANIIEVPDCSCEGLAALFAQRMNEAVSKQTDGAAWLVSLTLFEDEKNSATITR